MITNFYGLNHIATNIVLFAENTEYIYRKIEWLQNAVAKKMRRGELTTVEYLCDCSTMRKIVCDAIKEYRATDGGHVTKIDRLQARQYLSSVIMAEAKYIAKLVNA